MFDLRFFIRILYTTAERLFGAARRTAERLLRGFHTATVALVVIQHLGYLLLVIACDTVGQNADLKPALRHIIASRLYASDGVRARYKKLVDAVLSDECGKALARQRIAFGLYENIVRYYLHIGHKFRAARIGLERPRTSR